MKNREICGNCLHDKEAHTEYNGSGKFMYCANCRQVCEIVDFSKKPKPTSKEEIYRIQAGREYSEYKRSGY